VNPADAYPDGIGSTVWASSTLAYADRGPVLPDTAVAPPGQPDLTGGLVAVVLILALARDRIGGRS
jgi:hypothetical protein